jgi:superfamily I DNA/RNA helicase
VPSEVPDDYWEIQSPALIRAAAEQLPTDQKFDAVIVDEAQDFAPAWWDTVIALLRDPVNGGLFTFGDVGQTLFSRGGEQELGLVPLTLETNLRNTREISDGANRLTKSSVKCIGPEGPAIHFCEVPEWADVTVAGDAMASSMLNHYRPTDIALLHTHHRHPVHKEWERIGRAFYNKQYWEGDDIFYSTVMKFKGLERHCVVLVVDGFKDESRARELLYVGMTRAQDFLVVVSKRSTLSQFIDDDLMELLDENPIYLGDDIYQDDETDDDTDSET